MKKEEINELDTYEEEYYEFDNGMRLTSDELLPRFRNIMESKPSEPHLDNLGYSWDEGGLSQLFMETYKDVCRYCPEKKSWYLYEGGKWTRDVDSLIVSSKVKEFIELLDLYAWTINDEEKRNKYKKFLIKAGDRRFRDRLIKDAKDVLPISASMFDNNPYLINCKNGTYDLKTNTFRTARWDDYLTMQTNFEYYSMLTKPKKCKRWEQFIEDVMQGDKVKMDYLKRALGYSILGGADEECMFICYGKTTRNGKSTMLNAIQHLLGDYASVSPVSIICKSDRSKNAEAPSPTLAGLKGKRFVTMAESNQYGRLDEETIKQLTGGEEISARALYENSITYLPQFTMWLSCNDLPSVQDKSIFASDRLRVIEFNKHFSAAERDTTLKSFFREEESMRGIFTWLVEGYNDYVKKGLEMPKEIKQVVNKYEKDNDYVLQFLEEKCERDEESFITKRDLYANYKLWCKFNGYYIVSAKKFNAGVQQHPTWYDDEGTNKGYPTYKGLKVK